MLQGCGQWRLLPRVSRGAMPLAKAGGGAGRPAGGAAGQPREVITWMAGALRLDGNDTGHERSRGGAGSRIKGYSFGQCSTRLITLI